MDKENPAETMGIMDGQYGDGLFAALGSFNIRALADCVAYISEGKLFVSVRGVKVYARDIFNFDSDMGGLYLGLWSCEKKKMHTCPVGESLTKYVMAIPKLLLTEKYLSYVSLSNVKFKNFRFFTSKGADFLVLSNLYPVANSAWGKYEVEI